MDTKKCEICGKPYRLSKIPDEHGDMLMVADCECELDGWLMRRNEREFKDVIDSLNLPKKYRNEDMKDWIGIEGTEKMTELVKKYMQNVDENLKNGTGMIIAGAIGTGKTKIQCYMLRSIVAKKGVTGYFISFDELSRLLSSYKDFSIHLDEFVERLSMRNVLVLDDLGESQISEWRKKHLTYIINQRYYNSRVTLINTMKGLDEAEDLLGKHIMSRIFEMCGEYKVDVESETDMRRMSNKEKHLNAV